MMSNQLSLLRKSQTIITYLNDHLPVKSRRDIADIFSMMRSLQSIFPQWVLSSCPMQNPGVFFITDNCKQVIGFDSADLSGINHANFLLSRIHEDDLEDMYQCFSFIESFLKETMPEEYMKLRFVLHYRFRHKHGHYIHIHHEKAILPLEESEPLFYSIIKDVSQESVFKGVKLDIYHCDSGLKKLAEYFPRREQVRLSKRENDIITLMQSGLSTKQIADRLNISQHTARNIKQKMFEKYRVNNSIALLNRALHNVPV